MADDNVAIALQALPKHIAFSKNLARFVKCNLSDSTAQALTLEQLCRFSSIDIGAIRLDYSPVQGYKALRTEIVNFHQSFNCHSRELSAEDAVTFCGAQEALFAIYQAVLSAGDEIIVMTPSYPSLVNMAKSMGVVVKEVALKPEKQWQVDIEDFKGVISERTRMIVLNSPHNPTGSVIDSILAEQVLVLTQQYQCFLLSDDVSQASNYLELALAHRYLDYENSIIVGVMSKSLGLAGVRIGWAVTPNKVIVNNLLAMKAKQSICCSKIDETLATIALQSSAEIIAVNNDIIVDNIALFAAFISRHQSLLSWHPPKAGTLALVEVNNIDSMMDGAENLVKKSGVLALPSELFGLPGNYFRIGLGQKSFANTLEKFDKFLLSITTDRL